MDQFLKKFRKFTNESMEKINKKVTKRKRKLDFKSITYCLSKMVLSKKNSYAHVVSEMNDNGIFDGCISAVTQKRNSIDNSHFKSLHDDTMAHFYDEYAKKYAGKYTLKAIDGTHVNFYKQLTQSGYEKKKNTQYVDILIGGVYDITNDITNNFHMSPSKNEREVFIRQIAYVNPNDIVIADRGYYSGELLYQISLKDAYSVFRLKKNHKCVKELLKQNIDDYTFAICNQSTNNVPIKMRVVKYTLPSKQNTQKEEYYLGTTLLDKNEFSVHTLSKLYQKRWNIEVHFKHMKYDLNMNSFHSLNANGIAQEIYVHQYVHMVTKIIEANIIKHTDTTMKEDTQFNKRLNLHKVVTHVLPFIFYKLGTYTHILNIVTNLVRFITKYRAERHFKRVRKLPGSKWIGKMKFFKFKFKRK